jgi:riboflavin synthase
MFSGLVLGRGRVIAAPQPSTEGARLRLAVPAELRDRAPLGASLAVDGVCLTVATNDGEELAFELSPETLARSTLGALVAGQEVNLEPALRLGDAFGGHWVQGHVDATGEILATVERGDHREVTLRLPAELTAFVVEKGSITVDGVSLTVARLAGDRFVVALVPHTLAVTTLGESAPGRRVNLEVDVLSKYVHQAVAALLGRNGR